MVEVFEVRMPAFDLWTFPAFILWGHCVSFKAFSVHALLAKLTILINCTVHVRLLIAASGFMLESVKQIA